MNNKKKLFLLVILLILCAVVSFPVAKAKFIKSNEYSFSVITKALTPESTAFGYTGGTQEFETTKEGYYIFQVWGANGGNSSNGYAGGTGDSLVGMSYFSAGQRMLISVGGIGKNGSGSTGGAGGYNGGGNGGNGGWFGVNSGGGGGGLTFVSLMDTVPKPLLIAGGGGGGGAGGNGANTMGGSVSSEAFTEVIQGVYNGYFRPGLAGIGDGSLAGGNYSGNGGSTVGGEPIFTNSSDLSQGGNGKEGYGGNAGNWAGGGGGGFYGGAGGSSTNAISGGGGAGSSYYDLAITVPLSAAITDRLPNIVSFPSVPYLIGNGYAIITYVGKVLPEE